VSKQAQGRIYLAIFDVHGRHVQTLASGAIPPVEYAASWDGRDANGIWKAAGLYFVRLKPGGIVLNRRADLKR
jgi:hypothetical protein